MHTSPKYKFVNKSKVKQQSETVRFATIFFLFPSCTPISSKVPTLSLALNGDFAAQSEVCYKAGLG